MVLNQENARSYVVINQSAIIEWPGRLSGYERSGPAGCIISGQFWGVTRLYFIDRQQGIVLTRFLPLLCPANLLIYVIQQPENIVPRPVAEKDFFFSEYPGPGGGDCREPADLPGDPLRDEL